jgi:hypothetical protein
VPTDPSGLRLLEAIAPLRDAVRGLVEEAQRIKEDAGRLPDAGSPAMAEIAKQADYAGLWSPDPLRLAQSISGLCIAAVEDYIQTLCSALEVCPGADYFRAPVYGHMPQVRAAVESSGRASWLLEPGIAYKTRAARAVADLLYSRWEQSRATGRDNLYKELRAKVETECRRRSLQFKCQRGLVTVGEDRPGNEAVVRHLFRGKPRRLARTLYGYYSGGSHAVVWALLESVDLEGGPPPALGTDTRYLFADARRLGMALAAVGEGYRIAVEDQWEHMGWGSADWDAGVKELETLVLELAGSPPAPGG